MKVKFDVYVLWPLAKKFQNWIVDRSTARDITVYQVAKDYNIQILNQLNWNAQPRNQSLNLLQLVKLRDLLCTIK